jgi:hypothetical protein
VFLSMHKYSQVQVLSLFNTIIDVVCKALNDNFKTDCVSYK